ncbi:GrpB family protein [Kribbella sp. CA-247076]|uniref:GrpB family protein n=1 Tax=Kribbella sp. CA-247076 TaxID=3239941 RepID=UPI003D8F9AFC
MGDGIVVVGYDEAWVGWFREIGGRLRQELGDLAVRIDHVGSTAVHGLDAKPVIDVQVSVAALEPVEAYRGAVERAGFVHRAENPERTKRYFRERPGDRRTHVHVRRAGSFSEQFNLLFREYLRAHPQHAREYGELKRRLAKEFPGPDQRSQYVDAKGPFIWRTIQLADEWAQSIGWEPPRSDC